MVAIINNNNLEIGNLIRHLENEFSNYVLDVYPGIILNAIQFKEVRQAFFSGILWHHYHQDKIDEDILVSTLAILCGVY